MINTNKNILLTATVLAFCIILFVHVFLFPLYDVTPSRSTVKLYADLERSLCAATYPPPVRTWPRPQCPRYGIVTTVQGGRLGNQMWAYAAVWAIARRTGLEPYVPRCIHAQLAPIFDALTVPTIEEIAHCAVNVRHFVRSPDAWNYTHQSILLPRYTINVDTVLTWARDIVQEFTFRHSLAAQSGNILRAMTRREGAGRRVYVGVHVRRTDYISYLSRRHGVHPATVQFYVAAMRYFEHKWPDAVFVVVSDDPSWCVQHLGHGRRNVHVTGRQRGGPNAPALDLAILAACNHTIIDYGTFGVWGAILAGGETIFYNLSHSFTGTYVSHRVAQILPNWRTIDY